MQLGHATLCVVCFGEGVADAVGQPYDGVTGVLGPRWLTVELAA